MKNLLKLSAIIIGSLMLLYQLLAWTGAFRIYNNPTNSNEPSLPTNSKMIVSNLVQPENGNFICYTYEDEFFGNHIRVHRLCGKESDSIEIRNGILYINGKNADIERNLMHYYKLTETEFEMCKTTIIPNPTWLRMNATSDTLLLMISDTYAKQKNFAERRYIASKHDNNKIIEDVFGKQWNEDQFGPVIIPPNKYFVLGDNRHGSDDSRFIGFIDKAAVIGTVIIK